MSGTSYLVVWNDHLCSAHDEVIIVWKNWKEKDRILEGHTDWILSMVAIEGFLFSGSGDSTIRKWNQEGQCLSVMQSHKSAINFLLAHNRELYSASTDMTIKRWNMDGQIQQEYKGHTDWVQTLVIWRDVLFSAGWDDTVIQWGPIPVWSPATHSRFPAATRGVVKVMVGMSVVKQIPLPLDLLFIVFQFYCS